MIAPNRETPIALFFRSATLVMSGLVYSATASLLDMPPSITWSLPSSAAAMNSTPPPMAMGISRFDTAASTSAPARTKPRSASMPFCAKYPPSLAIQTPASEADVVV